MTRLNKFLAVAFTAVGLEMAGGAYHLSRSPDDYNLLYDLTHKDRIDIKIMAEHYGSLSLYWQQEVARRYSDAIVILAHGGPGLDGYWSGQDQISGEMKNWEAWIEQVRADNPYRRIVLISCNPNHQYLGTPRVTYALSNVWFYPDSMMVTPLNDIFLEQGVGDIFDFVENP